MLITHPLDTVKTNMQSSNLSFTKSMFKVYKAGGVSFQSEFLELKL